MKTDTTQSDQLNRKEYRNFSNRYEAMSDRHNRGEHRNFSNRYEAMSDWHKSGDHRNFGNRYEAKSDQHNSGDHTTYSNRFDALHRSQSTVGVDFSIYTKCTSCSRMSQLHLKTKPKLQCYFVI
ncbi:reticulocyte-binding protein 2 homolog a [Plakobranchus ocellatus]|uniref:Reticulocyte-binding protein 2 homolog a n=1 Tax=Plakobranchus ocellatus TaxID=259542 RepID=A0AAV3ZQB4_9GAST|nr:reticulocyte-binding protein 2 homolog a [Plakobranchus ocellatus]